MNSKRKVSKADERTIRENEYIGRVLNEKVKELDKLKLKFERKLQQEKEKFAVHHLSVTSSFNERKGPRHKKISLAFDSKESNLNELRETRTKSTSDSQLSNSKRQEGRDGGKIDCLFPPLIGHPPGSSTRKPISRSFSEGVKLQRERAHSRHSGNGVGYIEETFNESQPIAQGNLPKWQRDLLEESRSGREKSCERVQDSMVTKKVSRKDGKQELYEKDQYQDNIDDSDRNFDVRSDSGIMLEMEGQREKGKLGQLYKVEKVGQKPRSRQHKLRTQSHGSDVSETSSETTDEGTSLNKIARVNMVKNLTKQQRYDLEHQVTFLPPMSRKFNDEVSNDSTDNEMDTKRLSMAKKRWLKAYNIAKANFQGQGPKIQESTIREIENDNTMTPEHCSKDPRLLELVSLLCKRHSISKKPSNML